MAEYYACVCENMLCATIATWTVVLSPSRPADVPVQGQKDKEVVASEPHLDASLLFEGGAGAV